MQGILRLAQTHWANVGWLMSCGEQKNKSPFLLRRRLKTDQEPRQSQTLKSIRETVAAPSPLVCVCVCRRGVIVKKTGAAVHF